MKMKTRVLTLVASVGLLAGTAFVASGVTGAYFSDTVTGGEITGTLGTIAISQDSPGAISFSDLLPGTAQTVQVDYQNTGNSPQDVWLNFNNLTALSALNNSGRYGKVIITSTVGAGSPVTVESSLNLNDRLATCGSFDPNIVDGGSDADCNPVPSQILLASAVAPGTYGNFTFTFEYAPALGNTPATSWNPYPLVGLDADSVPAGASYATCIADENPGGQDCTNNQTYVNEPADGSGAGLPYQLIATQVGITPGQIGGKF
jgi:hypothetical protein